MHFSLTVIPEKEAEYPEGYPKLKAYLADNGVHKIKPKDSTKFQQVKVRFTINEKGAITQACISESSKDASTDTLLLQTIQKMPKWSPAENAKGERVKQEFELVVGNAGC